VFSQSHVNPRLRMMHGILFLSKCAAASPTLWRCRRKDLTVAVAWLAIAEKQNYSVRLEGRIGTAQTLS
jgi:hypothetical protein